MEAGEVVCPTCGQPHPSSERFCETCGMPLVYPSAAAEPATDERRNRARKPIRSASASKASSGVARR